MLDRLTKVFPTPNELFISSQCVWVPFAPRLVAEAVGQNVKQPTVLVLAEAKANHVRQQFAAVPVMSLISTFCSIPAQCVHRSSILSVERRKHELHNLIERCGD